MIQVTFAGRFNIKYAALTASDEELKHFVDPRVTYFRKTLTILSEKSRITKKNERQMGI